jgi:hypothetical protein
MYHRAQQRSNTVTWLQNTVWLFVIMHKSCTLLLVQVLGSSDSATELSDLPVRLVAGILQHVPQQQRLGQCAMVCSAWALAAARATVHVVCEELQPDAVPALQSWLSKHAAQLLGLELYMNWRHQCVLQLPVDRLTKLQSLRLQSFKLQLPGGEGSPRTHPAAGSSDISSRGSAHAAVGQELSSLLHLELVDVQLPNISSLLQVTNAPQLTSLRLDGIDLTEPEFSTRSRSPVAADAMQEVADAMPHLVQQLPELSVLQMPEFPVTQAAMQQIAAMTRLQRLFLFPEGNFPAFRLQHLPCSITQLELEGDNSSSDSLELPPELPQLSGLLHLDLRTCAVAPALLGSFMQLQVLSLYSCRLFATDPDTHLQTEGTAALLDVLPKLTTLQDLGLHVDDLDIISIALQRFSALTASSHLTKLFIVRDTGMSLPRGAVQHMFPPGRQMQSLQKLEIMTLTGNTDDTDDDEPQWCVDSADVLNIISACPQLQSLGIANNLQPDADLSVLLQLAESCTSLYFGGAALKDATVPVLVQLTQLKDLALVFVPEFTDAGLEQLTQLQLTTLCVHNCGLSEQICPEDSALQIECDAELVSAGKPL